MQISSLKKVGFFPERFVFGGYMTIMCGFIFIFFNFSKPKIKTTADLYFISGHFQDYSFINGQRGTRNYTFRLKEFSNSFKIKADFLGGKFKKYEFEQLNFGDSITVAISATDRINLNTNKSYFFVFAIANANTIFLDSNFTIKKHNDNLVYYFFIFFVLLGSFSIYLGKRYLKEKEHGGADPVKKRSR